MADPERLPPPPFWRTRYYALHVMGRPGRRIDPSKSAARLPPLSAASSSRTAASAIGFGSRVAVDGFVSSPKRMARPVHDAFWDRGFNP
jgi:hypothetical protein